MGKVIFHDFHKKIDPTVEVDSKLHGLIEKAHELSNMIEKQTAKNDVAIEKLKKLLGNYPPPQPPDETK